MINNPCGAKRKRAELWTGVSVPHQQSILHPYLQAPRVYKAEQWRCTCGYEPRCIPTRLCHCYALIRHPSIHGLEPRLHPTPAGQRPVRAETRIQKADMYFFGNSLSLCLLELTLNWFQLQSSRVSIRVESIETICRHTNLR